MRYILLETMPDYMKLSLKISPVCLFKAAKFLSNCRFIRSTYFARVSAKLLMPRVKNLTLAASFRCVRTSYFWAQACIFRSS